MELEVCHHYRIPHSEFLAWSADDRDKAIWTYVRAKQTCPQCGTRPDEWDPEQGGHRHAYVAEVIQCPGCQALSHASSRLDEDHRGRGYHAVLKRNPKLSNRG